MILWYMDRFGLPAGYRSIWIKLLSHADIPPSVARPISLHKVLGGTLLAKFGNRKAPTWAENRETEIRNAISHDIRHYQPKLVVLSSPESLCVTNVMPEDATLLKLRGSVYEYSGVPAVVILPMSAWATQVSSKEIGQANYGEVDAERFDEAHALDDSGFEDTLQGDHDSEDRYFYEPVLVPVGKFMLRMDMNKLGRLYNNKAGEAFRAT